MNLENPQETNQDAHQDGEEQAGTVELDESAINSQARRCVKILAKGWRCRSPAHGESEYCWYHDPEIAEERTATQVKAGKKGGMKKNHPNAVQSWQYHPIKSNDDLKDALSELFNAGMAGDISPTQLTALSSIANALVKVLDDEAPQLEDGLDITSTAEFKALENDIAEALRDHPEARIALSETLARRKKSPPEQVV
jgi:hypothetical protein